MKRKTVLITGSSRGIGKAIAIKFAKEGYQIVINCAHHKEELLPVKKEIEQYQVPCLTFPGDVGDYDTVKEMVAAVKDLFGTIDVLINNAGISHVGLLTETGVGTWNRIISTNLTSVYNCCHLIVPDMVAKHSGKIINISSVWGCVGASCEVAYSASKGGINAFTKALAKELAPSSIQVNAIACGAIDTQMNQFLDEEEKAALIEEIPANRLGMCEEVAEFAYQLANGNDYLTGQVITLDGGWI